MGDFNLPNVDWDKEIFPFGSVNEYFHKFYLHNQPMFQIVPFATREANTLDLIFTTIHDFFSSPPPLINLDRADHVLIKFEYFSNIQLAQRRTVDFLQIGLRPLKGLIGAH